MRKIALTVFGLSANLMLYSQQFTAHPRTGTPIPEKFQSLPLGAIMPTGALRELIASDLSGFTGHLDSLVPDLILNDDIYGKDRLTKKVRTKDLGALGEGGDWQVQFLWWNSETQSNWWDGYIRSAVLTGDRRHLQRTRHYIARILSTQDPDGYLGIYDKELRYRFDNENGELWSKTTLLRGLLGWYEYSRDPAVLKAVERAVKNVMDNYPAGSSKPFYSIKPDVGGLSHGLAFTDVLEWLYRINGNTDLLQYAAFCYRDFSGQILNEDAQLAKLLNPELPLKGHGVHTYEHLRSVAAAYQATGDPETGRALKGFLQKIGKTTTATGGPVGDEWIGGKGADATSRGYEYCSIHELMHSYLELYQKSGDNAFAEKAEHMFLNAALGARDPQQSCIAYLKSDNSYAMTGGLNGDNSVKTQTRYKYSPAHQDAAVCCVPNAGRIIPYYVQHMWMKEGNDLVASLLGPCILNTKSGGKKISVTEETSFPAIHKIRFIVEGNGATFALKIRKPSWSKGFRSATVFEETSDFLILKKKWTDKEVIELELVPELVTAQDVNKEYYFQYGPLVLAHPLKAIAKKTRSFPVAGFSDLMYSAENPVVLQYLPDQPPAQENDKPVFIVRLFNPATGRPEATRLEPVGQTILRQVTFKPQQ